MNTTPLAPSRALPGKHRNWARPVTKAVMTMNSSIRRLPYFSSMAGPMTSSRSMLDM